jgi:hypothetical protein
MMSLPMRFRYPRQQRLDRPSIAPDRVGAAHPPTGHLNMTDRGGTPLHNLDWPGCALFGLYRASRVALVTPLRDGMSLVGKEFIAAQDPADPGVLSRFAGATAPLDSALLVNPCDIESTV